MIDIKDKPIVRENRELRRLIEKNKIRSKAEEIAVDNCINFLDYEKRLSMEYQLVFSQPTDKRFKRILKNITQPDIHELYFFSKYFGTTIEELIEGPEWKK